MISLQTPQRTAWGQVRHLPCNSYAEGLEMLTFIEEHTCQN